MRRICFKAAWDCRTAITTCRRVRRWRSLRAEYKRHVTAILTLAGFSGSPARAARIVDLETKMAKAHATRVESANVTLAQPWQKDALATKAPGIDWPALLDGRRPERRANLHRLASVSGQGPVGAGGEGAPRCGLEGLARVSHRERGDRRPAEGVRRRGFCVLRKDAERDARATTAMAARCTMPPASRSGKSSESFTSRALLSRRESQGARDGGRSDQGL